MNTVYHTSIDNATGKITFVEARQPGMQHPPSKDTTASIIESSRDLTSVALGEGATYPGIFQQIDARFGQTSSHTRQY